MPLSATFPVFPVPNRKMDAATVLQTVLSAIPSGSITITPFSILQLPTLITYLLSLSAVRDWLKLFLIGAALESSHRFLTSLWFAVENYFWLTVTLDESDDCGREYSSESNCVLDRPKH